jgi:hypothetical protein
MAESDYEFPRWFYGIIIVLVLLTIIYMIFVAKIFQMFAPKKTPAATAEQYTVKSFDKIDDERGQNQFLITTMKLDGSKKRIDNDIYDMEVNPPQKNPHTPKSDIVEGMWDTVYGEKADLSEMVSHAKFRRKGIPDAYLAGRRPRNLMQESLTDHCQ